MSTINTYKISRVNSLPESVTANTIYFVKAGGEGENFIDVYVSGNNGALRHLPTLSEINTKIGTAVSNLQPLAVANIEARDALQLKYNNLVLVLDATGDSSVKQGAAMYFYTVPETEDGTGTWTKVSEWESMDLSMDWDSIKNKPESTVQAIDEAVNKTHTHANSDVLNALGVNVEGKLTYNNVAVSEDIPLAAAESSVGAGDGVDGLLSSEDKALLDSLAGGDFANQNAIATIEADSGSYAATSITDTIKIVGSGAVSTSISDGQNQIQITVSDAVGPVAGENGGPGTPAASGLMPAADKTKLDRITIDENGNICVDGVALGTLLSAEEW